MTRIGICKVNSQGRICHKNAYARELCDRQHGEECKLYREYLSQPRSGPNQFVLPEVVYQSKEHVAAVALKTDDGFQIYFRSIENEPAFKDLFSMDGILQLTQSEISILEKVLLKKSNQEIADSLFICLATVKTHIAHLYQKIPKLKEWRNQGPTT